MKLLLVIATLLSSPAFAELPPPGTARKGKVTVDPNNKGDPSVYDLENVKVVERAKARAYNLSRNKEVEDLKRRIKDLEADNRNLRSMAESRVSDRRSMPSNSERVIPVITPSKKNRVSAIAGWGPASLTNERRDSESGNEIEMENSPLLGAQYQRLFGDTWSVGFQLTVPTVPDTKKPTYGFMGGFDF